MIARVTLEELRDAIGPAHVRVGGDVLSLDPGWHPDNLKAGVVVAPATAAEVAFVVSVCRAHGIGIVPQGGRTGLVGGGISQLGDIVLSLARLNRIVQLDPVERVAVAEAGVTLEHLQQAAMVHRLEPGIDLPSRGSATLGGMVSTNAGGIMAFRNGVMRHRVLGLEAVLPDGSIYSDLTRVVKNAAGYDLKHLFIGAEGTLGIVTRVALRLDPVPRASATALFGLSSVAAVLEVIRMALDSEVGSLRAAEALWQDFFHLTSTAHGFADVGVGRHHPLYLILSLGGAEEAPLRVAFEQLFAQTLESDPEATGIIAASKRQDRDLWLLREDTDAVYRAFPAAPSYDISIPLSRVADHLGRVFAGLLAIDGGLKPFVFGHLADGNLHIILNHAGPLPPEVNVAVESVIYEGLAAAGGSFSAEHGVGSKRIHALVANADPIKLALMSAIKRTLDPTSLLNPGKLFPRSRLQ